LQGRNKILSILERNNAEGPAFWKGNPHKDALINYLRELSLGSEEDLSGFLGDDLRWRHADICYKHPEGKPIFDCHLGKEKRSHGEPGVFAETEEISDVDMFPWPELKYLDFSEYRIKAQKARDEGYAFFGGFWCPYFHIAADFFGMENYFIKMYENPAVVEAVTEHIVDFYSSANALLFSEMGDLIDVFFFGNDFGTQIDLFINPEMFRKFVLPGIIKLTETAGKYGIRTMLHSCGAVTAALPMIIEAGVQGLHPIQAMARGMDAESLQKEFGKDLIFMGGVDTQHLLPFGTPDEIRAEVKRLIGIFGNNYIISPSHEALLENVPTENLMAMSRAAKGEM